MTDTPAIGSSDVEIDLLGEKVVLRGTIEAALAISDAGGGVFGEGTLAERLKRYDLRAYIQIIRVGLGLGPNAVKDLDEKVFRSGMVNLIGPLTKYVIGFGDPDKRRGLEAVDEAPFAEAAAKAQEENS